MNGPEIAVNVLRLNRRITVAPATHASMAIIDSHQSLSAATVPPMTGSGSVDDVIAAVCGWRMAASWPPQTSYFDLKKSAR